MHLEHEHDCGHTHDHPHTHELEHAHDHSHTAAPRDELIVLSAEIEDENFFVSCHDLFFLLNVISNV